MKVVGTKSPPYRPLTEAEDTAVVARMNEVRPDIIWVGLGAPKQERWMDDHRDRLNASILIGVGAAFDFHTGRWIGRRCGCGRAGLEWSTGCTRSPSGSGGGTCWASRVSAWASCAVLRAQSRVLE